MKNKMNENSAGDTDAVLPNEAHLVSIVEDIDNERIETGVVHDIGLMRRLAVAYTRAEITKEALFMEGAEEYNDVLGHRETHYEKLAAMWGGDRNIPLFSPMDALTYRCDDDEFSNEAFDDAVTSIIAGLPATRVNWAKSLMYAMRTNRSSDILMALCSQGAFFDDDECDRALREIACELPEEIMESVLSCLRSNSHGDFFNKTAVLNDTSNDRGTMIHLCCCSPGRDTESRIRILDDYGVNPTLLSSVTRLRAADMLALHEPQYSEELRGAMRLLMRRDAGPIRHHAYEVAKLCSGMASDVGDQIMKAAFHNRVV
jgi:hypothetical protein